MQQSELEAQVRTAIRKHYSQGNGHIKVKHVVDVTKEPPQRISPIFQRLVDEGMLSVWRETSGNPTVYRISV